ncbi:MAG: hypothetical protein WBH45_09865 [Acidobacteriaceae bacterium]
MVGNNADDRGAANLMAEWVLVREKNVDEELVVLLASENVRF